MAAPQTLLSIADLTVHFDTDEGVVEAVNGVSLEVRRGEIVGLVGESGSGKTVTAQSILRLTPCPPARYLSGKAVFNGEDLLAQPIERLRQTRGAAISMIFQEPMTALSPLRKIGDQLCEALRLHCDLDREAAWKIGAEWLEKVGIPEPAQRMSFYPHHLSGGMRQRVMIAMALLLKPQLVIADEPSTALDVTVQAQIFRLLLSMKDDDTSMLLITHDLAVVWEVCDRVYVMKDSRIVEQGDIETVFAAPAHDYTRALLHAAPRLHEAAGRERPAGRVSGDSADAPAPCPPDNGGARLVDENGQPAHAQTGKSASGEAAAARRQPAHAQTGESASRETAARRQPARAQGDKPPSGEAAARRQPARAQGDKPPSGEAAARRQGDKPPSGEAAARGHAPDKLLEVTDLRVWFPIKKGLFARTIGYVKAVDNIDLVIPDRATVGLVGESGSGKTTLGRAIIGLQAINRGSIRFDGMETGYSGRRRRQPWRRNLQMIFQDPYASLNPRMTIMDILTEGLEEHGLLDMPKQDKAAQLLEEVELNAAMANRYPFEFSGGERQRVSIARALSLEPRFIVCDEPVSALDVTIQAQIIDLLRRLQARHGIAYLFISHDLSVVRQLAAEILVMCQGQIVERGPASEVISNPQHAYTRTLLDAVPALGDPERRRRMRGMRGGG